MDIASALSGLFHFLKNLFGWLKDGQLIRAGEEKERGRAATENAEALGRAASVEPTDPDSARERLRNAASGPKS